jgi:hypothetical protein
MKRWSLGIAGSLVAALATNCGSSKGTQPDGSSIEAGQAGESPVGDSGASGTTGGGSNTPGGASGDSAGAGGEGGVVGDACGGCPHGQSCVDAGDGPECVDARDCDPAEPISGLIAADVYWKSGVCVFDDDVTVDSAARLLIGGGVVVKSGSDPKHEGQRPLVIQGKLIVLGSDAEPVVFTALWDAKHGGKTVSSTASPGPGAWAGIRFENGSTGKLEHADIWYASDAIYIDGASPTLVQLGVHQASGAAISAAPTDTLTVDGFASEGSGVNGLLRRSGHVTADTTWDQTDAAQVFDGDITVDKGATLKLVEGVVVKSGEDPGTPNKRPLIVRGTLEAKGTSGNHVTFTARWDDLRLGEADATAALPVAGAWSGLQFESGSNGKLDYVDFLFAENGVLATDSSPSLSHCWFRNSTIGIRATGPLAAPAVTQSEIVDNGQGAVAESNASISASENWWGNANGPSGAGPGSGDSVSTGVDYSNPLDLPPL